MILLYVLFALTTGIVALYELVIPVMWELAILEPEDVVVKAKYTSYITFFIMSVLTAPILIFPCIIPSIGDRFRYALLEALRG